ncbi:hypothetical protein RN001_010028 [Aquatica leii]|uniref:DUF243 domain-containing protein n=1 Tax=Aquatica leii TaxID=1421715 RepID=A0AAN7PVY6_9COLE|nr:hypothetical protein RN001_010028 [Aquatica leii]
MKLLGLILSLATVSNARPDVSHLPSGSYLPTGGQNIAFETSFVGGSNLLGGGGHLGLGGNLNGNFGGYSQVQDQKHVYFYAAPDEEQHSRLRINIAPSSQRNTKIIFVKAPSYGGVVPEVIAPPSLSEDKTLVYVLVKKPEQGGQITIPAGAGVKQAKPEVYFIKYKTQQDAQQQIHGGLQGQPVGSNIPDLGNEASFVRSLESGLKSSGIGVEHGIEIHGSSGSSITSQEGSVSGTVVSHGPPGASGPY